MMIKNYFFAIFTICFAVFTANGQISTQTFRGYIDEDQVNFTLTFNRGNRKINGFFYRSKDGIKKQLVGEFYKQPKMNPKFPPPTPDPFKHIYESKINTTNYFNLYEVDPKTKKKIRRFTHSLSDEMEGTWVIPKSSGLTDITLIREFDGIQETYQINETNLFESTPKYVLAVVYPSLSGENMSGIKSFNEFIEQKIQATVIQFKQAALKLNPQDIYAEPNAKWKLTTTFHTKFSNDRFVSLAIKMDDNVIDSLSNALTQTADFNINFDLKAQKEVSLNDLFEADSEHLKAFSEVCKETFRNVGWSRYSPNTPSISLKFCDPEAANFNNWFISTDGFNFTLKPIKTSHGEIFGSKMKVTFERIEKEKGKFKKDGIISELRDAYFRKIERKLSN